MDREQIKKIIQTYASDLYGIAEAEITVEEENLLNNVLNDICKHKAYTPKHTFQMTSEQRKKISDSRKGYVMSDEQRERIRENSQHFNLYQYDKLGNLISIWKSTREAGRAGYNNSLISKVCRGKKPSAYGCVWRYKPVEENDVKVTITVKKTFGN